MAIVVPNVDVIKSWAMENNIPGTLTVLCNDPNVKELIVADMLAWGKEGGLKSFEQVRLTRETRHARAEEAINLGFVGRRRTATWGGGHIIFIDDADNDALKCALGGGGGRGDRVIIRSNLYIDSSLYGLLFYRTQVKDVYLHPDLFSVQNGLLTPNLKLKRAELKSYFRPQLDDMYRTLT